MIPAAIAGIERGVWPIRVVRRPNPNGETETIEIERLGRITVKVEDSQARRWPVRIDRGIGEASPASEVGNV
jgi:hypothetical protein